LKTKGTVELTTGVREERYTLTYQSDSESWKTSKFISVDGQTFSVSEQNGEYTIKFDLQKAINRNADFADAAVNDYERVVLAGEFNEWAKDPDYDYQHVLTDDNNDDVWQLTISDQKKIDELNNSPFKVVGITTEGEVHYAPSGMGGEQTLDKWLEFSKN